MLKRTGEYRERLKTGGKLVVTATEWKIAYYFSGPDLRYSGTFFNISSHDIDKYIDAWKQNFDKYLTLKNSELANNVLTVNGVAGMSIWIGGIAEGVCLRSYHMPIASLEKLQAVISDYNYAKGRAVTVMSMLGNL